jgi:hypothetical protein
MEVLDWISRNPGITLLILALLCWSTVEIIHALRRCIVDTIDAKRRANISKE